MHYACFGIAALELRTILKLVRISYKFEDGDEKYMSLDTEVPVF